jgi:hypothetical protein
MFTDVGTGCRGSSTLELSVAFDPSASVICCFAWNEGRIS